jgi:hypothetical protein
MKLTGENRRTRGKTCPSATLSITNPTWTDPGSNPGLRGRRPAANRLRHGTARTSNVTGRISVRDGGKLSVLPVLRHRKLSTGLYMFTSNIIYNRVVTQNLCYSTRSRSVSPHYVILFQRLQYSQLRMTICTNSNILWTVCDIR